MVQPIGLILEVDFRNADSIPCDGKPLYTVLVTDIRLKICTDKADNTRKCI